MDCDPARVADEYVADYPYQPRAAVLLLGGETESNELWVTWLSPQLVCLVAFLCICFAASDVAVAPLMWTFHQGDWGALLVYVSMGAILAQAGLFASGLVFGPGSYWMRLLWFWLGAVICFALWTAGIVIVRAAMQGVTPKEVETAIQLGFLSAPLAALAIQSPLWFFRLYRGWRLAIPQGNQQERTLTIRDYFIGTAMVAFSITLARQGVPSRSINDQFWAVWGIVLVIAASLCLVSVIPALLVMFRCDWRLGFGALLLYATVVPSGFLAIAYYAGGSVISLLEPEAAGLVLLFVSFAVFLALGLKAARDAGFCLVTRRRSGTGAVDFRK